MKQKLWNGLSTLLLIGICFSLTESLQQKPCYTEQESALTKVATLEMNSDVLNPLYILK